MAQPLQSLNVSSSGPDPLTVESFRAALPDRLRRLASQSLVDQVNQTLGDPEFFETFRDNLLGYGRIMQEGRWTLDQYVSAVRYVSHKLGGASSIEAYSRTFPDKIARFQQQGVHAKDIASYVTAYNKSKLVNLLYEQSLIPTWVLNQDHFQQAINTQVELMLTARSEKVRVDAANSLLTHLKPPEVKKVELNVGLKDDGSIAELRRVTAELAEQQRNLIQGGAVTAASVARSTLRQNRADDEIEDAVVVTQ